MYTTFETFDPAKLTVTKPEKKSIPTKPGQQTIPDFWQLQLQYNYGTDDEPNYGDFDLEFNEVRSPFGVSTKYGQGSISLYLDPSKYQDVIDIIYLIYNRAAELLEPHKITVGRKLFNKDMPEATGFSYPSKEHKTDPTKHRTFHFKLFSRGFGARKNETYFSYGEEESDRMTKEELIGADMKYQPVVTFKGIFVNSVTMTLQSELKSALIIDVDTNNFEPKQVATIQKLQKKDPELKTRMANKHAKLKNNVLPPAHSNNNNNTIQEGESNETSIGGINPTTVSNARKKYNVNVDAIKNNMTQ